MKRDALDRQMARFNIKDKFGSTEEAQTLEKISRDLEVQLDQIKDELGY